MQILDVPVFNDDGTIQFTQRVSKEEAGVLLQFALNYFAALGLHTQIMKQSRTETLSPEALLTMN